MKVNGNPNWAETQAGQQLQERLTSEKTLKALDHLLQRIDTLEKGVERLNTLLEQGPGLVSMAVDTVDDSYQQAARKGVDVNERLSNALHMAEQLTAPEMVERLDSFLKFADQAPGIASMMADMADDGYRQATERGIDIEQRLGAALQLAEKLTAPKMVEQLEGVLKLVDQAPGIASMMADMADEGYRNAAERGIDIEQRLGAALQLAEKLTAPKMVEQLEGVLKLAGQAPGIASMMADMADEGYRNAAEHGIDIEQRLGAALQLAEQLTAPEMVEQLDSLLKLLKQAPGIMAMAVDVVDETIQHTSGGSVDIAALSKQGIKVAGKVSDLVDSDEFDAFLQSELFNPKALDVLSVVSGALVQCRHNPPQAASVFQLLRSTSKPEMKKTLGFLMSFGQHFGRLCQEVQDNDLLQNNKKQ